MNSLDQIMERIESLPVSEGERPIPGPLRPRHDVPTLARSTHAPKAYRTPWERPQEQEWRNKFTTALEVMDSEPFGGILGLIGSRGTGKTRLALEVMRDRNRRSGYYATALRLFVEIRSTYAPKARETEHDALTRLAGVPLLVIDEIQVRGETRFEDNTLTDLLDRRHGDGLPTILIANLHPADMEEALGASISDRITEGGGLLEMNGESFRGKGGAA